MNNPTINLFQQRWLWKGKCYKMLWKHPIRGHYPKIQSSFHGDMAVIRAHKSSSFSKLWSASSHVYFPSEVVTKLKLWFYHIIISLAKCFYTDELFKSHIRMIQKLVLWLFPLVEEKTRRMDSESKCLPKPPNKVKIKCQLAWLDLRHH